MTRLANRSPGVGRADAAQGSAALVPVPGFPFPVEASAGLEAQARKIAARCSDAYDLLSHAFERTPAITLLVLAEDDWNDPGLPYGMPYYADGQLVVAGEPAQFWRLFVPLLEHAPAPLREAAVQVYGKELDLSPFFNLLAVHELGHSFPKPGVFPRHWLDETFANLCLHAYIASREQGLLPVLEAFPNAVAAIAPTNFPCRSLHEFETVYSGMDAVNYGWFQCHFHVAARGVYDSGGIAVLKRFFRRFSRPDDDVLAAVLLGDVSRELAKLPLCWPA
jgi:hypothetical protein